LVLEDMNVESQTTLRLGWVGILSFTGIFFLIFVSRTVFAPLMPTLEKELQFSHGVAGVLFLVISVGFFSGQISSGFISSQLTHRQTIFAATLFMALGLIGASFMRSPLTMGAMLFLLGGGAGLYLPSGVASITALIRPSDWGKALGIHLTAPSVAFVFAPLITEAFLGWLSWQGIVAGLGTVSLIVGASFLRFGHGGDFSGEVPGPKVLKGIVTTRFFWVIVGLFGIAVAGSAGLYAILPLYLTAEQGMELGWANTLVALSRLSGLFMTFVAGWMTDRVGERRAILTVLLLSGILTILLGATSGRWLMLTLFLQPAVTVCFFPAGFTAISRFTSQTQRNVFMSMVGPFAFLFGAGMIPAMIGYLGEVQSFSVGIVLCGVFTLFIAGLAPFLQSGKVLRAES
jgi:NNP family nitrate/nitrite transporter-like MFS transporter